jgi:hypothetical protein
MLERELSHFKSSAESSLRWRSTRSPGELAVNDPSSTWTHKNARLSPEQYTYVNRSSRLGKKPIRSDRPREPRCHCQENTQRRKSRGRGKSLPHIHTVNLFEALSHNPCLVLDNRALLIPFESKNPAASENLEARRGRNFIPDTVWCSKHDINFQFLFYLFFSYFFSISFLFVIFSLISTQISSDIIEESESTAKFTLEHNSLIYHHSTRSGSINKSTYSVT